MSQVKKLNLKYCVEAIEKQSNATMLAFQSFNGKEKKHVIFESITKKKDDSHEKQKKWFEKNWKYRIMK